MLSSARALNGCKLSGRDGDMGKVKDLCFDDRHWTVRYLVADTGTWLKERLVLISPHALGSINSDAKDISVDLTTKQIEGSPSWDSSKPVSRQFEQDYYRYYGWPMYWEGSCCWGSSPYIVRDHAESRESTQAAGTWSAHLRSTNVVTGYHIEADDGAIGHVDDFILDDETWTIRYLVATTQNWWPGKKVLISPQWIERVSWSERKVLAHVSRETIRHAPEFTGDALLTRDYETSLHGHYNRKGYWVHELADTVRHQ